MERRAGESSQVTRLTGGLVAAVACVTVLREFSLPGSLVLIVHCESGLGEREGTGEGGQGLRLSRCDVTGARDARRQNVLAVVFPGLLSYCIFLQIHPSLLF